VADLPAPELPPTPTCASSPRPPRASPTYGASTRVPGLFFVGVPWMRARKSPLLMGVGEDAEVVVERLAQ